MKILFMILMTIQQISIGFAFGLWGALLTSVLTHPSELFSFIPRFFVWLKGDYELRWWEKPLYACPYCVAGWHCLAYWLIFVDISIPILAIISAMSIAYYLTK
jgi:hypothetical protein